jgi:hypothetical protein
MQYETTQPPTSGIQSPSSETTQPMVQYNIGDTLDHLPDGSKLVTINGEQLYETPDDVYLKGESNNGVVQFRVVGK